MAIHYRMLLPVHVCPDSNSGCGRKPGPETEHGISSTAVIASVICSGIVFVIFWIVLRMYNRRNNTRRRSFRDLFAVEEYFLHEERGPEIVNPIWYIHTVGLQQSIIDSITVFKYKKDERLVEGTECSVCLNEFQEDESLRLLPKCSHAFHIPCIDTWLKSHKNCPLCRAPVVSDATIAAEATVSEGNSSDLGWREGNSLESTVSLGGNDVGAGRTGEIRTGDENLGALPIEDDHTVEDSKECASGSRGLSALAGNRIKAVGEDMQPMRRSVSLDSSSAAVIFSAVAGFRPYPNNKQQGSWNVEAANLKWKTMGRRGSGSSSSISKLRKGGSMGRSLSKGPMLMKRSLSSGGKVLASREGNGKSQNSILGLSA